MNRREFVTLAAGAPLLADAARAPRA